MTRKFQTSIATIVLFFLLHTNASAQKFKLPDIPKYDSTSVDAYKKKTKEVSYYLDGEKVFEVGYNTGSMLYTPFYHIGGGKEDSCYAYFNGKNHEDYDFYYISDSYIRNDRYSETSKIFHYSKFDWDNTPIEKGDYYFIKEMYESTITHNEKYRIGKWVTYDSTGTAKETIDYDNYTINNKKIKFEGNLAIIESLKKLTDNKIKEVYGKKFFSKYVRFNLAQSGYYTTTKPRPEQPGGYSLLKQADKKIEFVDLSYDIIIDEERFNVMHFRVSKGGEFLGHTHIPGYVTKFFDLTRGLDSLNNGKFHKNVLKWEKVAAEKGMDINSKDFNVKFKFIPVSNYYGELRLVLEQITESTSTKYSFTNKLQQYIINPWTGEIEEAESEEGIEMEMDIGF